jgi:hypothetical protein
MSTETKNCGLVMPISAIDGCTAEHWNEVRLIIIDAVESIKAPAISVRLVSDSDDVGVIQKRIVQNLYSNDIVVCDVSAKNANVMLELGMRLAFDKPTIIIKDDQTDYSFDTSIIEHIPYPRDLRFSKIIDFKEKLRDKVLGTLQASEGNPDYTPFLGHFTNIKARKLQENSLSSSEYIIQGISEIQDRISRLQYEFQSHKESSLRLNDAQIGGPPSWLQKNITQQRGLLGGLPILNDTEPKGLLSPGNGKRGGS